MDESVGSTDTAILAGDLPDSEEVIGKLVNIQPTAPIQSGIAEQKS